jgi:hypothetical protein
MAGLTLHHAGISSDSEMLVLKERGMVQYIVDGAVHCRLSIGSQLFSDTGFAGINAGPRTLGQPFVSIY